MYLDSTVKVKVRVLFFGAVADAVDQHDMQMELYSGQTVGDAHASFLSRYPKLEGLHVKYAVDQQYCSGRHVLADGEELAFFTAVSGG